MSLSTGSPSLRQQVRWVRESARKPPDSNGIDAGGSKFDRQGYPIQAPADIHHEGYICIFQGIATQTVRRAIDKELDRRKLQGLAWRQRGSFGRDVECRKTLNPLSPGAKDLAARRQDSHAGGSRQQKLR